MTTQATDNTHAERVWFRLLRLHARTGGAISERLKSINLSVPQFDVVSTLTEREGVNQQELAERLYVTKGNISGLIDRLAAAGLVERRSLANDRRSHAIYLTPEGRSLALQGIAIQRAFIAESFGCLTGHEAAEFERLIIAVRDATREAERKRHARAV